MKTITLICILGISLLLGACKTLDRLSENSAQKLEHEQAANDTADFFGQCVIATDFEIPVWVYSTYPLGTVEDIDYLCDSLEFKTADFKRETLDVYGGGQLSPKDAVKEIHGEGGRVAYVAVVGKRSYPQYYVACDLIGEYDEDFWVKAFLIPDTFIFILDECDYYGGIVSSVKLPADAVYGEEDTLPDNTEYKSIPDGQDISWYAYIPPRPFAD